MQTVLNAKRKQGYITVLLSVLLLIPFILLILGFKVPLVNPLTGVCLMASVCGFVWAWELLKEARQICSALDGRTTVAHWKYTDDECLRYVELWFPSEVKDKKGGRLFYKIALTTAWLIVIVVSIGIISRLSKGLDIRSMPTFLLVLTLIAVFCLGYSLIRRLGRFSGAETVPEVYISNDGVLINNHYFRFHNLISMSYSSGNPSVIEFFYQIWGKYGAKNYKVGVPVPAEAEHKVDEIFRAFGYQK